MEPLERAWGSQFRNSENGIAVPLLHCRYSTRIGIAVRQPAAQPHVRIGRMATPELTADLADVEGHRSAVDLASYVHMYRRLQM